MFRKISESNVFMSKNGKGDRPRPKGVDYNTWEKNYNRIFKKGKDDEKINKEPKR